MTQGNYSLKGKAETGISVITALGGHGRPFCRGPCRRAAGGGLTLLAWSPSDCVSSFLRPGPFPPLGDGQREDPIPVKRTSSQVSDLALPSMGSRQRCHDSLVQAFSACALWTLWVGSFFIVGDYPVHCRVFRSISGHFALDASSKNAWGQKHSC